MAAVAQVSARVATRHLAVLTKLLSSPAFKRLVSSARVLQKIAKWIAFILLLLNIRSFPLVWHFKVFNPVFRIQWQYILARLKVMFKPRKLQEQAMDEFFESLAPVGTNPFDCVTPYQGYSAIDECDFNIHLSNSSYAKSLDPARFKAAVKLFPQFLRAGGTIPLAATHYHFIKEIPPFTNYEARVSIGAWDEKWLYVLCRIVTQPKKKSKGKKRSGRRPSSFMLNSENPNNLLRGTLCIPADAISSNILPSENPLQGISDSSLQSVASRLIPTEEPDGATLHTISVTQVCFKLGRITVPPAIVLACNGFAAPPAPMSTGYLNGYANGYSAKGFVNGLAHATKPSPPAAKYSATNPPPHWEKVRSLIMASRGGSMKTFQNFLKGGWKEYAPADRWWDEALGGAVEQQRRDQLEALNGLRTGMNGARKLY